MTLASWKESYDKPRDHNKKQRHHFADKGSYSQSYRTNTQKNMLFIIGEQNAKVGSQKIPVVTGNFALGVQNEAGQRLAEFCQEISLVIANTLFQQCKRRFYTQIPPDGKQQNQIDYITCSQRRRNTIQSAKIKSGADCGSEHELLIAKFRLKLKKVGKTTIAFTYDLNQTLTIIQWK